MGIVFLGCWFVESVYQPIYWISSWSTKNRYFLTAIYILHLLFLYTLKRTLIWASFDVGPAPGLKPSTFRSLWKVALYQLSWSCQGWSCVECESNGHRGSVVYLSVASHTVGSMISHGSVDANTILFTLPLDARVGPFLAAHYFPSPYVPGRRTAIYIRG